MTVRKQMSTVMATIDRLEKPKQLERIIARAEQRLEVLEAEAEWEDAVETKPAPQGHYSNQFVRCGKENCKCANGELHGPYWYHYKSIGGGRYKKTYIGKDLPTS